MGDDLLTDPLLSKAPVREGYKVLGGVVLYQKLGQGGMGAAYRGRHLRLDIDVALKVTALPPATSPGQTAGFLRRFIREARTAAAVRHPNLIRVYDVNAEAGVHYLIMDYVEGESAADRLRRRGASGGGGLSEQEAVEICLGAAEGLAAAHSQGIVHRDVKPDNILIDKKGSVVVADLGLAKGEDGSALSMGISLTQQAMGTPFYMSPEQTRSAKDVGPAADVWSLGVTLYQLVSGELPWRDADLTDLINRIRNDPPPDVKRRFDGLSDGLCTLIRKALRKAPEERFPDCGEMASALRDLVALTTSRTGSVLPDAEAGTTKMALVSVAAPVRQTLTLIAQAALTTPPAPAAEGATPVFAGGDAVRTDEVVERRMDIEEKLERFVRENPGADARALDGIRKDLRVAEATEGKDVSAALGRLGQAESKLVGLQGTIGRELAGRRNRTEEGHRSPAKRCGTCGQYCDAADVFCLRCGHAFGPARRCPSCGHHSDLDDVFCVRCGNELG